MVNSYTAAKVFLSSHFRSSQTTPQYAKLSLFVKLCKVSTSVVRGYSQDSKQRGEEKYELGHSFQSYSVMQLM